MLKVGEKMNQVIASKDMLKKHFIKMNESKVISKNILKEVQVAYDEYYRYINSDEFIESLKLATSHGIETIKEPRNKIFGIFNRKPLITTKHIKKTNKEIDAYVIDCFKNMKTKYENNVEIKYESDVETKWTDKQSSFNGVEISWFRKSTSEIHVQCCPCVMPAILNINKCIEELELMMEAEIALLDVNFFVRVNEVYNLTVDKK